MTTTSYYGFGLRERQPMDARQRDASASGRFLGMIESAERAIEEPFIGITTDGTPLPLPSSLYMPGAATAPVREAVESLMAALNADQRAAASLPLDSSAWRGWSNIHPFIMRHGALMESMTDAQREKVLDLLRATLSNAGFTTARDIMRLNHTIGEITNSWSEYGEWLYWVSIFGTPSATEPWGWQIDGHHLNLSCFVLGDRLVLAPAFMGSEPVLAEGGKFAGTRVFEQEESAGLDFLRSLPAAQQGEATVLETIVGRDLPEDVRAKIRSRFKGAGYSDNAVVPYEGIVASKLDAARKRDLLHLVEVYVGRLDAGYSAPQMGAIEQSLDETRFAWMGESTDTGIYYYRVHSPVILIEFDHQGGVAFDNSEPSRNHIHTVVRIPNGGDYGKDLLRTHYQQSH